MSTDCGSVLIWKGKESRLHRDISDPNSEPRECASSAPSLPNPTESSPEAFRTVGDLQRKVNELQGMVRSLTAGTEQGLTAAGCEVGQALASGDPTANVPSNSHDDIDAASAAPRSEMMVRSGSEEELLKMYRERRASLASEASSGCKAAKSPRGSLRAPVTPRVVPPQSRRASMGALRTSSPPQIRRASTGALSTSSPRFAMPTSGSPEGPRVQSPAVGARMPEEQHRIFTSALRGGRECVTTQGGSGGAATSCPGSFRASACSTPVQASRRRSDPSPVRKPESRARAATPRSAPKTTPKSTPRRSTAAGPVVPPLSMHPLLAFAAEVQGLKANASCDELSIAEPPTTPPLSARVASSRLGTPPASSHEPTSTNGAQKTVVVPPCAEPAAKKECQSTPACCASASGASTRASTPRVSGSTPGNDSAWESRADDSSADPSAAPTPTAPSYTLQSPLDSDSHSRCRGLTPMPVRHSPATLRATSLGIIGSSDAGALGRSVQAPSAGPSKCFIDDFAMGQQVPLARPVFGQPQFVFAPGARPIYPTTFVAGGRTFRSGSASAVRQHPVGLCQPQIAVSSRTLSPARIEQLHPQVRCQMKF